MAVIVRIRETSQALEVGIGVLDLVEVEDDQATVESVDHVLLQST